MSKGKWTTAAEAVAAGTKSALQTVYDALNQGPQKKILKNAQSKRCLTGTAWSMGRRLHHEHHTERRSGRK